MKEKNKMGREKIDFRGYAPGKLVQKIKNEEDPDIEINGFETLAQLRKYNMEVIQSLINACPEKNYFHKVNEKSLVYFIEGQD